MRRKALAFALAAVIACGIPAFAQTPGAGSWRSATQRLLEEQARAIRVGDEAAFRRTIAGADPQFVRRSLATFRRFRAMPVAGLDLRVDPNGFDDLALALQRRLVANEVHVVQVTERLSLRRFDRDPEVETAFLTVVRRGSRWTVFDDDDVEDLGLQSSRGLWDFGAIRTTQRGNTLAVYHPVDRNVVARMVADVQRGIARTKRVWPYPWDGRVIVAVPDSASELERIFQSTFDLSPFVAFTSSTVERVPSGWHLSGHRIYVQPDNFFRYGAMQRMTYLDHELLHYATRAYAGPFIPAWFEEGVAQLYGESPRPLPTLAGRAANGTFDGRLPEDWEFTVGPKADIQNSYEEALSFTAHLADRFGRNAPARLYRALGATPPESPGTARYHLDRATRSVLGATFASLELDWAAAVRGRSA
jgi:hypothetical protein